MIALVLFSEVIVVCAAVTSEFVFIAKHENASVGKANGKVIVYDESTLLITIPPHCLNSGEEIRFPVDGKMYSLTLAFQTFAMELFLAVILIIQWLNMTTA